MVESNLSASTTSQSESAVPESLVKNVYVDSVDIKDREVVQGYDFNKGLDYQKMFATYRHTGFQATSLGLAIEEVNKMIKWRLSDEPIEEDEEEQYLDPEVRAKTRCTIYLGYTSNMASCGMREYIRYLCQHKMVD